MVKLTKPQQTALNKVRQALANPVHTKHGGIRTGANSQALGNLKELGYIETTEVYAYGICADDLKLTAKASE
jgi:hypothetical protein